MAVALALGQAAELTRELKDVTYKGAPAYLVSWHLRGDRGGRECGAARPGGGQEWGPGGGKERRGGGSRRGCNRKRRGTEGEEAGQVGAVEVGRQEEGKREREEGSVARGEGRGTEWGKLREKLTLGSRECSGHSTWSRLQYVLL